MKALEILKKIYANNPDTRFQRNNIDINFTIHDFSNVNEAIKELEALENRSCEGCKHSSEHYRYQCLICEIGVSNYKDSSESMVNYDFYCNRWESK